MKTKEFLQELDDKKIIASIAVSEKKTSGEIRVFVSEKKCSDPVESARLQFEKLGMTKTRDRNGVLIYFAPQDQQFAILGDTGIHEKCGADFWREVRDKMTGLLRQGLFTEAVVLAVQEVGAILEKNFPRCGDDTNELPDAVARD